MDATREAPTIAPHLTSKDGSASATSLGWIIACVVGEGIGMTVSAAAARASEGLPGSAALTVLIVGGLIEGTALGVLQAAWLTRRFPGVSRLRWVLTTVLIAGIGWALASAPAALSDPAGAQPDAVFILLMAAGLGLAMGALLGVGQALVLRHHVRHPWRWVSISAVAWTPAMVVIFAGATVPDASWPTGAVIAVGALTGVAAGALLGLVSLALMRTLTGQSVGSGVMGWSLRHGVPGLGGTFALLRVRGAKSGRVFEFPVQYAREGNVVVVFPGGAARKNWWRNLRRRAPLSVWIDGGWMPATGRAITGGDAGYSEACAVYGRRWPRIRAEESAILARIDLAPSLPDSLIAGPQPTIRRPQPVPLRTVRRLCKSAQESVRITRSLSQFGRSAGMAGRLRHMQEAVSG